MRFLILYVCAHKSRNEDFFPCSKRVMVIVIVRQTKRNEKKCNGNIYSALDICVCVCPLQIFFSGRFISQKNIITNFFFSILFQIGLCTSFFLLFCFVFYLFVMDFDSSVFFCFHSLIIEKKMGVIEKKLPYCTVKNFDSESSHSFGQPSLASSFGHHNFVFY